MRIRLLPESSPLGWTPFAWLVYLSFFVVYAVWTNSPRAWLIDGPALALFLVLYFRGFWLHGRALLRSSSASSPSVCDGAAQPRRELFFIYAAAFVGDVGRPAIAGRWLLVILAITAARDAAALAGAGVLGARRRHLAPGRRLQHPLRRDAEEGSRAHQGA